MTEQTPRALAKAQTKQRIKELALRQLADSGAGELSLRAIARELNLVSSAIYRYFASRDELLTALIIDAYDDVATAVERATARTRSPRRAWLAAATALRGWAVAEPHRFALVYGSAIPGYAAPAETIEPAARVVRAVFAPVAATVSPPAAHPVGRQATVHLQVALTALEFDAAPAAMFAMTAAWSQLIGVLTLELGGHFVGTFDPADHLFTALIDREAAALGL